MLARRHIVGYITGQDSERLAALLPSRKMPILAPITHRTFSLRILFGAAGLTLEPLLARGIHLEWSEIAFVCETPSMTREAAGWREKPNEFRLPGERSPLANHGMLELGVVVRDRRPVIARVVSGWNRLWVASMLKPMLDASDRQCPDQSLLRLEIYRTRLDAPLDDLLDLLAAHCRFDLVGDF